MFIPRSCPYVIVILSITLIGYGANHTFGKDDDREKKISGYVKYVVRHYGDAVAGKEMLKKKDGLTDLFEVSRSRWRRKDGSESSRHRRQVLASRLSSPHCRSELHDSTGI